MRFAQSLCIGLGLMVLPAATAAAQVTLENPVGEIQEFFLDSGVITNDRAEFTSVYEETIRLEGVAWLRLYFGDVQLQGDSYLKVTSLLDQESQILDINTLRDWNYSTAYFNGNSVRVELVGDANSANRLVVHDIAFEVGQNDASRGSCGICAPDDRTPSAMNHSCRLLPVGCSATVYHEESCMVTAGHCLSGADVAQFNVPPSNADCSLNNPPIADQFPVNSTTGVNGGVGNDWGVITTGLNNLNQTPFDRYGMLIPIGPAVGNGTPVDNWGYGIDSQCVRNQVQQHHNGAVNQVNGGWYGFSIDITFGNSGSNLTSAGGIIGVVSHCSTSCSPQSNIATRTDLPAFAAAIAAACEGGGGGEDKCKGDGNGDGVVDVNDLLGLLAAWGPCPSGSNCDVGFVCGGDIPWCTDDQTCVCVTRADGTGIDCVLVADFLCSSACVTDADCEAGRSCYIDTCCAEGVCGTPCPAGAAPVHLDVDPNALRAIGSANQMNAKRVLSPAGDQTQQVDGTNPDCPYDFNGDGVVDVNDLLSLLANWGPCPMDEDCEVGFVCGDPLVICGTFEGFDCACFTHFSGQPICVANSSCSNPPCPNGDVDCPPGFLCTIDTCCADNVCLEDCGGNQLEDCDVGFTCGDVLEVCPVDPDNCVCVTNWDGTPDCVDISGSTACSDFVTCNGGPAECPAGTTCIINTCCEDAICMVICGGGGGGGPCDVGFTCGDQLTICPPGGDPSCFCWTSFDGGTVCGNDGSCGTTCFDGICPTGMVCVVDTCCTDPTCIVACDGQGGGGQCDVGFVCGGEVPWCNDAQTCACFTLVDGSIECCQGGPCDTPCQSNADCPAGAVCAIDTCCGEPICAFLCTDASPSIEVEAGAKTTLGVIGVHDGSALKASGN